MAISQIPPNLVPSDNWTLISSGSANGVASVTFSGIATTYSKLLIVPQAITFSSNSNTSYIELNTDSTVNNYLTYWGPFGNNAYQSTSNVYFNFNTRTSENGFVIINSANTTNLKTLNGYSSSQAIGTAPITGLYRASAAITSVAYFLPTTGTGGTVYLYGVSA